MLDAHPVPEARQSPIPGYGPSRRHKHSYVAGEPPEYSTKQYPEDAAHQASERPLCLRTLEIASAKQRRRYRRGQKASMPTYYDELRHQAIRRAGGVRLPRAGGHACCIVIFAIEVSTVGPIAWPGTRQGCRARLLPGVIGSYRI